jgi:transaldolase
LRDQLGRHTGVGELLPADGGDCEEVLGRFAKAGIDVDRLAWQLQEEGAKSFVRAWNDLMDVLASKSTALNGPALKAEGDSRRMEPGSHGTIAP